MFSGQNLELSLLPIPTSPPVPSESLSSPPSHRSRLLLLSLSPLSLPLCHTLPILLPSSSQTGGRFEVFGIRPAFSSVTQQRPTSLAVFLKPKIHWWIFSNESLSRILSQFCLRSALNGFISSRSLSFPLPGCIILGLQMNISPKEKSRLKHPVTVTQSHGSPNINEKEAMDQDKAGLNSSSLKKQKKKQLKNGNLLGNIITFKQYVKKTTF